jgi:hypothetical protein
VNGPVSQMLLSFNDDSDVLTCPTCGQCIPTDGAPGKTWVRDRGGRIVGHRFAGVDGVEHGQRWHWGCDFRQRWWLRLLKWVADG